MTVRDAFGYKSLSNIAIDDAAGDSLRLATVNRPQDGQGLSKLKILCGRREELTPELAKKQLTTRSQSVVECVRSLRGRFGFNLSRFVTGTEETTIHDWSAHFAPITTVYHTRAHHHRFGETLTVEYTSGDGLAGDI